MIWIIGCAGMLGSEIASLLKGRECAWIGSDRECDIRRADDLLGFVDGRRIDWIINCAAYTSVDKAEEEFDLAWSLNAQGAGIIAGIAARLGARLIQISTDYVFDGTALTPYREDSPCNPVSAYGRTKAEGEVLVARNCPRSFIVRTAWLYGKHGPNFVRTVIRLLRERESLRVVSDQIGSPTWTRDLSNALLHIVESDSASFGTYHFTDEGEISWYEFACAIRDIGAELGLVPAGREIVPVSTAEYPTKAKRPGYSVLSKDLIASCFGIQPPFWIESLRSFLSEEPQQ